MLVQELPEVPARSLGADFTERFQRRDPEALGVLFDRFAPNVYAALSPVERDAGRLDRLVEEVFWEVWASAGAPGGEIEMEMRQRVLRAVASRLRGRMRRRAPVKGDQMGTTVLLVEDDADNQEIYRLILTHSGYAVLQARDGETGVRMARHHAPDLILMDLTMPVIDGLEATRMLKADPATAAIPIIALTAHAEAEDREAAVAAGCASFLAKPVAPTRVAIEVSRILALRTAAA